MQEDKSRKMHGNDRLMRSTANGAPKTSVNDVHEKIAKSRRCACGDACYCCRCDACPESCGAAQNPLHAGSAADYWKWNCDGDYGFRGSFDLRIVVV